LASTAQRSAEQRKAPKFAKSCDIMITTHTTYVNAVGHPGSHKNSLRSRFMAWRGGTRLMTIVDEALPNVVEKNKVTRVTGPAYARQATQ
jgi:hypothetical protein